MNTRFWHAVHVRPVGQVVGGAVTTGGAAVPLLFTQIVRPRPRDLEPQPLSRPHRAGAVRSVGRICKSRAWQVFFREMGVFILFTAFFGILFSFFLLMPLFMICGPVGEMGDVTVLIRRLQGGAAPAPKKAAGTVDMEMQKPTAEGQA